MLTVEYSIAWELSLLATQKTINLLDNKYKTSTNLRQIKHIAGLAGWLSWLKQHPIHQKRVVGVIPSQTHT